MVIGKERELEKLELTKHKCKGSRAFPDRTIYQQGHHTQKWRLTAKNWVSSWREMIDISDFVLMISPRPARGCSQKLMSTPDTSHNPSGSSCPAVKLFIFITVSFTEAFPANPLLAKRILSFHVKRKLQLTTEANIVQTPVKFVFTFE